MDILASLYKNVLDTCGLDHPISTRSRALEVQRGRQVQRGVPVSISTVGRDLVTQHQALRCLERCEMSSAESQQVSPAFNKPCPTTSARELSTSGFLKVASLESSGFGISMRTSLLAFPKSDKCANCRLSLHVC